MQKKKIEVCIKETDEIVQIKKKLNGIFFTIDNAYLQHEIVEGWK
ncbi:hypothetical protein [Floricoccus tropicus]|nr:hypothetical protein [Floricoccus tropicus]